MSQTTAAPEPLTLGTQSLEEYEPLIGAASADRILKKSEQLADSHIVHISSTFYGGGVTEILTPLTLMMNSLGIETGWRMIQGTPAFFHCTKKLHNALQGEPTSLTDEEKEIYEQVALENSMRLHIADCDAVIVHDPQPLPLICHYEKPAAPWIWQCHVDLSSPNQEVWRYLKAFAKAYSAAVLSLPEYDHKLPIQQFFITPAINPFAAKNCELTDRQIANCLAYHRVPTDRPIVCQISRFDHWKDPLGVIEAVRKVREEVDCTLVLLGNNALDDPEGAVVLETVQSSADDRTVVLTVDDPLLVNALQRKADVVVQKSIREGFGLTVTEAMWKGSAVVGGNVGGIRKQIIDGQNGFLVDSVDQAASRIAQLLKDKNLRIQLGERARQSVRENYLMSRLVEDWIDLLMSLKQPRA
jgi:trehalose synthase